MGVRHPASKLSLTDGLVRGHFERVTQVLEMLSKWEELLAVVVVAAFSIALVLIVTKIVRDWIATLLWGN